MNAILQLAPGEIVESTTNPRRTFGEEALQEMAESLRAHGMLQPITVRPVGDTYELVCGARRLRAAKLAEMDVVPVIVRELDDQQALEVQLVENCQRQDVHPLEEAEAIHSMLQAGLYDSPERIAERIGRAVSYVRRRLRLMDLQPEVRRMLASGEITLGWAEAVGTAPAEVQNQAVAAFREAHGPHSAAAIRAWLLNRQGRPLSRAIWGLADTDLLPQAGACIGCPHNTRSQPGLWDREDGELGYCTKVSCFEEKAAAHKAAVLAPLSHLPERPEDRWTNFDTAKEGDEGAEAYVYYSAWNGEVQVEYLKPRGKTATDASRKAFLRAIRAENIARRAILDACIEQLETMTCHDCPPSWEISSSALPAIAKLVQPTGYSTDRARHPGLDEVPKLMESGGDGSLVRECMALILLGSADEIHVPESCQPDGFDEHAPFLMKMAEVLQVDVELIRQEATEAAAPKRKGNKEAAR